jgi:NAD(P)-dependent dehydrogenase (short-subunit alcohol dehydrogenase family)
MVGTLKTLGQISDFLAGTQVPQSSEVTLSTPPPSREADMASTDVVPRLIVDIVDCPAATGRGFSPQPGRWIGVLGNDSPMVQSLVSGLQAADLDARELRPDQVGQASAFCGAAGLILCSPIDPETAFLAAKHAGPELLTATSEGDALLVSITKMDGAFGFTGNAVEHPEQGALSGLVKTAALEWDSVICRAIDLAPDDTDPEAEREMLISELTTIRPNQPLEVGLGPDKRVALQPIPAQTVDGPIGLNEKDVVVVTGGARGVTAACTIALAKDCGASIAIIGRTAPNFQEPGWLQGIQGEAAMKKAIVQNAFAGKRPTPKAVEKEYRRQVANRAITATLEQLRNLGVRAGYFSADVTDSASLEAALNSIRDQFGTISGVIHGAGVLHDRLIVDKSLDHFRQVYTTKVAGLNNLLDATRSDNLRHLILFSSVSARTGNTGQCDYAMANEVLNKMARAESLRRPACRVTAINWGPWDGGMVTPALKKAFSAKQIDLIPLATGARLMVSEMKNTEPGPVEVIIGSMLATPTDTVDSGDIGMALLERRELDLKRYPVLASHVIGGKPVVPFALISEWIGHGALKDNPGYALHGIDDFRLLSGIRLEQEKKLVRLMAGKARKNGDGWQVEVELRNGVKNGRDVIHSRARALLVDRFPEPPVFSGNGKNGGRPYPKDLKAVYSDILFHGDQLRAISAIDDYSDHGMTAKLTGAPNPQAWMQDPIQERWMADPMVLDGAFQMAIVWCHEQTGMVCLPSYARTYRQYRSIFPTSGVTAVMPVTASTPRKMVADFIFLDGQGQVVATLNGYEATVDPSLVQAFKDNGRTSTTEMDCR